MPRILWHIHLPVSGSFFRNAFFMLGQFPVRIAFIPKRQVDIMTAEIIRSRLSGMDEESKQNPPGLPGLMLTPLSEKTVDISPYTRAERERNSSEYVSLNSLEDPSPEA